LKLVNYIRKYEEEKKKFLNGKEKSNVRWLVSNTIIKKKKERQYIIHEGKEQLSEGERGSFHLYNITM